MLAIETVVWSQMSDIGKGSPGWYMYIFYTHFFYKTCNLIFIINGILIT